MFAIYVVWCTYLRRCKVSEGMRETHRVSNQVKFVPIQGICERENIKCVNVSRVVGI